MDLNDSILKEAAEISEINLVDSRDIPRIDLYMEQVTSFLEQEMGASFRFQDECVFTNTMINNYTKAGVLPRPENKRYNKRHILTLIYIYLLKQNLSMPEIKTFTSFIQDTEQLGGMYEVFRSLLADYKENYIHAIEEKLDLIDEKFDEHGIDDDTMKAMTFIALSSFDATLSTILSNRLLNLCRAGREETEAAKPNEEQPAAQELPVQEKTEEKKPQKTAAKKPEKKDGEK